MLNTVLRHALTPVKLGAKEGLAMINGTQLIASLGSEAVSLANWYSCETHSAIALQVERADMATRVADVACAMSLEVLKGTVRAFHPLIHEVRPHAGQQVS